MKMPDWYRSLGDRERRTLLFGGAAVVSLLVIAGVWQLHVAGTALQATVEEKRADLQWMQAVAPQLQSLPAGAGDEALPLAVDRTAKDAGIGGASSGSEATGDGGLRVRFEGVPFDALIIWLARLQKERGVAVEMASIDATQTDGLVNAMLVLKGS